MLNYILNNKIIGIKYEIKHGIKDCFLEISMELGMIFANKHGIKHDFCK